MSALSNTYYDLDGKRIGTAVSDEGRSSGNDLAWKFFALAKLTGKTVGEIVAGVGMPTSRRSMANGQTLLEWQATGYHIALLFGAEDRVVKVTAQSARVACQR
jgi:hypothetical protein